MSLDLLGEGFDLHGGGLDLQFPHHENERAQAVALGREFSRRWMHNGMLVDARGHKMSKSIGNVISLPELLDRWDPRVYRLLVLQSHYRSPLRVGEESFEDAEKTLKRLDSFARRAKAVGAGVAAEPAALARFRSRMEGRGSYGPSSGNRAFDEYREETLKRLEEEQTEFKSFLDRLRHAKDKSEFDQFMAERRQRPPQDPQPQPQG